MGIEMAVEELQGVEAEIDLITEDRQQFGLIFPIFDGIEPPALVRGSILLLCTNLNPLVHRDGALLQEQVFNRHSARWKLSPRTLSGTRSVVGPLSNHSWSLSKQWTFRRRTCHRYLQVYGQNQGRREYG